MESRMFEIVANEIAAAMDVAPETLQLDQPITELGMDSLEALQLLVSLEQATQVPLDENDLRQFTTIRSIVNLLDERKRIAA